MCSVFGIIQMAWLLKKLDKCWYRCNFHQGCLYDKWTGACTTNLSSKSQKELSICLCQNGKGFIVSQVPFNSFSNLDVRVTFLQETARNRTFKLFENMIINQNDVG